MPLDVVHVHDPSRRALSSAALRHSRSLNVGTFHEPTERVLSTQVARPLVEIFFGRLDARTVDLGARPRELLERYFPGTYDLVAPGRRRVARPRGRSATAAGRRSDRSSAPEEERGALRLFLRALRRLPPTSTGRPSSGCDRGRDAARAHQPAAARAGASCSARGRLDAAELIAGADVALRGLGRPAPGARR